MPQAYSNFRLGVAKQTGFVATTAPNQNLIGRKITPRLLVVNKDYTGKVFVDTHASFMGTPQNLKLTPGGPMPRMRTADTGNASYTCEGYGLASDGIPKIADAQSEYPEPLVNRELRALKSALEIAEEVRYATLYQTAGNFTTTAACSALKSGTQWSTVTSQPVTDLRDFLNTVRKAMHNNRPTDMILPEDVAVAIGLTAEIRSVFYLSAAGGVAAGPVIGADEVVEYLASKLKLRVHLAGGRYNTANLAQSHTEAEIWTDTVWIGVLNQDAVQEGTKVRTVHTATLGIDETSELESMGLGGLGAYFSAGIDETSPTNGNSWIPYVQHRADEIVVSADFGATITNCLA